MNRLILIALLFLVGCSASPADLARLEARKRLEDETIIALVLDDFASRQLESGVITTPDQNSLVLASRTNSKSGFISVDQISAEYRNESTSVSAELIADLQQRNQTGVALEGNHFGTRTRLEDLSRFPGKGDFDTWDGISKEHPDAKAYVMLWLPGYDSSLSRAIVRFSFGPTAHSATATYLLVKQNSLWTILSQKQTIYL
ncbi:MAG: hypothetical protein V4719_13080 [Planctomycetota bacterium]